MFLPGGLRTGVRLNVAKRNSTYLNQKGCHAGLEELAPNLIREGDPYRMFHCTGPPGMDCWSGPQ